jgi:hypothetical protein
VAQQKYAKINENKKIPAWATFKKLISFNLDEPPILH